MEPFEPVLGIDFGASKICVAVYDEKDVRVLPNEQGEVSIPTCMLVKVDDVWLTGSAAKNEAGSYPTGFVTNIKDVQPLRQIVTDEEKSQFAKKSDAPLDWSEAPRIKLSGRIYSAHSLAVRLIREIRREVCFSLGKAVTRCAFTVSGFTPISQIIGIKAILTEAGFSHQTSFMPDAQATLLYHHRITKKGETIV